MKTVFISLSAIGLLLVIVPSFLSFLNIIGWNAHLNLMTAGTIIWFLTAPLWMKKEEQV